MKHTWVIILAMTISLVAPSHLALACDGGGGGGGGGGNDPDDVSTGASTQTSAPAGITMTEPPPIKAGPSGTTSPGPGIGSVVEEEPTESEGETQDPWQTLVDTLNRQREKIGLPPIQDATLPGGIVVRDGRVVQAPKVPTMQSSTEPPPAPATVMQADTGRPIVPNPPPPPGSQGSAIPGLTDPYWVAQGTIGPTVEQRERQAAQARAGIGHMANMGVSVMAGQVGGPAGVAIVVGWGAASTQASGGTAQDAGRAGSVALLTARMDPVTGEIVSTIILNNLPE
jgi:hypothetical protein